jgi:hypothetical protein
MLLPRHQNASQNCDIRTTNRSFENVSHFKYLGTTVTIHDLIQEEVRRRLNTGNTCYHLVQSGLMSKKLKIRIYKTIILPVVLYGCETWSLISGVQHRLRVFKNRVLMRIFGPKRDDVTGGWMKLHNEERRDLYSPPSTTV